MATLTDLFAADGDLFDETGSYPSKEALALISTWTGTPHQLIDEVFSDLFAAYGTIATEPVVDESGHDVIEVRLTTGGWSGCEDAISALKRSLFWMLWWESSHRGGLFRFHVPVEKWEEPMIEFPTRPDALTIGVERGIDGLKEATIQALAAAGEISDVAQHVVARALATAADQTRAQLLDG